MSQEPQETAGSQSQGWKEWGRREPSRRGYVIAAVFFAACAGISLYKVLTPGRNAFFAGMGFVSNVLMCSVMIAGFVSRTRRDREQGRPSSE